MIREFLSAGLVDHMHLAVVPILLGRGVRLWDSRKGLENRYEIESVSSPSGVTHLTFTGADRGGRRRPTRQFAAACRDRRGPFVLWTPRRNDWRRGMRIIRIIEHISLDGVIQGPLAPNSLRTRTGKKIAGSGIA
jgi:hypothetical protein